MMTCVGCGSEGVFNSSVEEKRNLVLHGKDAAGSAGKDKMEQKRKERHRESYWRAYRRSC